MQNINPFQIAENIGKMGNNPQQILMNMLAQDPSAQQTMEQLKNASGGASPEQIAKQLAKQNGISEQQLMQLYNKLKRQYIPIGDAD